MKANPRQPAKRLIGHSGCPLMVIERDGRVAVRKVSKSPAYNARLERQCAKQKESRFSFFRTPAVLAEGRDKGLFYFEMEYINGISMAEYLETQNLGEIPEIAELFANEITARPGEPADLKPVFAAKIAALKKEIAALRPAPALKAAVRLAFARLDAFGWEGGTTAPCHGDMTLENIIVSRRGFYLIDHLDAFHESGLADLGKLLQDLELYWSYRGRRIDQNTKIRCYLLKKELLRLVEERLGRQAVTLAYHALLLNLLRILPYASEESVRRFVRDGIGRVLGIIEKGEFR